MIDKFKTFVLVTATSACSLALPVFATVDWNWNQVPSDPAEIDKAMTTYQSGDVDSAISVLNNLKNGKSQDVRSRHILVDIYREQKRYPDAKRELTEMIAVFQQYVASHTVSPPWMDSNSLKCELGDICLEEGNQVEALNHYREALAGRPNLAQARVAIANILLRQGDVDGAKQQYKTLLETPNLSTGEKSYYMSALEQLEQAPQQQQQRQGQALPQGTSVPQGRGSSSVIMQGRGMTQGMPQGALMPNQSNPGQSQMPPASASPSAAGAKEPIQLALGDISSKKYESAIARLKGIIEKSPANAQAHYLLAVAYASSHQSVFARSEYEATLKYAKDPRLQGMASAGLSKLGGK